MSLRALACAAVVLAGCANQPPFLVPVMVEPASGPVGVWVELTPPVRDQTLDALMSRGAALFAVQKGLHASVDRGRSWLTLGAPPSLGVVTSYGRRLFAASLPPGRGLSYSDDDGATWCPQAEGCSASPPPPGSRRPLEPETVRTLRVLGDEIYAATDLGLFVSPASGEPTWGRPFICPERAHDCRVFDVAKAGGALFVATSRTVLVAGDTRGPFRVVFEPSYMTAGPTRLTSRDTRVCVIHGYRRVACTEDSGLHWADVSQGLEPPPSHPTALFVRDLLLVDGTLIAATSHGVYRAPAVGAPFVFAQDLGVHEVTALSHDTSFVYAGLRAARGSSSLYRLRRP